MEITEHNLTMDRSSIPTVSETILKRRKIEREEKAMMQKDRLANIIKNRKDRKSGAAKFVRIEQFIKQTRNQRQFLTKLKQTPLERRGVAMTQYYEEGKEPKVIVVILNRKTFDAHRRQWKVLRLLQLEKQNTAVLVKLNNAVRMMLDVVEPYVVWGYPSHHAIRELVLKRGQTIVDDKHVPLTDNEIVEKALGAYDIICLDDLVHELQTAGDHFQQASNFLTPFQLSAPTGGWKLERRSFIRGGDQGNREEKMDELLQKMT